MSMESNEIVQFKGNWSISLDAALSSLTVVQLELTFALFIEFFKINTKQ